MRRVSELIDAVRGALSGATIDPEAELALAQEVVRVCADTRERLVRAIDLMRQGLRGEAMVIIDVRPALAETAAALCDPVMQRWRGRCAERGLPIPQPIDADLVHELSDGVAGADDPRVDQLMRRLRYQNLAHASAHERLRTMWALRRVDPASVREDDTRAFEQAALKELMEELRGYLDSDDVHGARAVREELRRQEWSDRGIGSCRAAAEQQCSALEARHAVRRGEAALIELEASVMRGDVAAAHGALDRYEAIVAQVHGLGSSMPVDMQARASPLAQWVAERERSEAQGHAGREAVARLESLALSPSATPLDIERALLECDNAGVPVSEAMRESVERRIASERRRRARMRTALVMSAALCTAGVAAGIGWWTVRLQRMTEIASLVAAADGARERGDLDSADRLLSEGVQASPWMEGDVSIADAVSRIEQARTEAAARDEAFERAMEQAGDPKADAARLAAGETAARTARTSAQALRAEQWIASHRAERARRQQVIDASLMTDVAGLSARLTEIEAAGGDRDGDIANLAADAERLSRNTSAGPDAQHALQQLRSRIDSIQAMIARERALRAARDSEEQAVSMLVGRAPESYATALAEFIRNHPESARLPEYKTAALREPMWRHVTGLPEIAAMVARGIDSGDAIERASAAEAIDKAIEASPKSPWVPGLRSVRELCMPQDGWVRLLEDLITLNPVTRLRMVELKDGTRYYYDASAKGPVEAPGGKRVYTAMVSPDGRTRPVSLDVAAIESDGPSPQSEVFEELRPIVRGVRAKHSVVSLLAALGRIRESADIDPVLQAMLLERIMEQGLVGAPHLGPSLSGAIAALRRLELGAIEWIVPCNPKARPESREASEVIRKSVDVAAWQKQHDRRVGEVRRWLSNTRLQPVGILDRDESGELTARIAAKVTLRPTYALYAITQDSSGAVRLEDVGSVTEGGKAALSLQGVKEPLPAGTLLFGGRAEPMPEPVGP